MLVLRVRFSVSVRGDCCTGLQYLVDGRGTQKFKRLWCGKWCTERFFGGVFTSMDKEGTVNVAFLQYGRLAAELFVFLL